MKQAIQVARQTYPGYERESGTLGPDVALDPDQAGRDVMPAARRVGVVGWHGGIVFGRAPGRTKQRRGRKDDRRKKGASPTLQNRDVFRGSVNKSCGVKKVSR